MQIANEKTLNQSTSWHEIGRGELRDWDARLSGTDCPYQQMPFWVEAHELRGARPRFFCVDADGRPAAFVAILEVGRSPWRAALIDRGPFLFESSASIDGYFDALFDMLTHLGYAYARFTPGQDDAFSKIRVMDGVVATEPFPFNRDPRNSLMVALRETDEELLASFNATARRKIRKAVSAGYSIRTATSDTDFENAWRLFESLAARKRFQLSAKPKAVWREALRLGRSAGRAELYLCSIGERLVAAQLTMAGGSTCEATLSALDIDALGGRPSPAALLMSTAMSDARAGGCAYFNLGGPGDLKRNNHVMEFKSMFRPELHVASPPLCLVIRPNRYRLWTEVYLRGWRACRHRFGGRLSGVRKSAISVPLRENS